MPIEPGRWSEIAPAKLNLALHVRGRLPDGRHALETVFAFCLDGDRVSAAPADEVTLELSGPEAGALSGEGDNLVLRAATELRTCTGTRQGAALRLHKVLPVASGIGGGSADAAATLRLLTAMWDIEPRHALELAPELGSDVPACLLSMTCRGEGAGDRLQLVEDDKVAARPVLLVNPRVALSTAKVFAEWDGVDRGPLGSDWRRGRNDLQEPAIRLVPEIGHVLSWLGKQDGVQFARMSGSGATCFALFESEDARDAAESSCPVQWWRLATLLR